ncbi:hypothetical protein TWF281_009740 [Arthrobotrys megalospora]
MSPITQKLTLLFSKLTSKGSKQTILTEEQEFLLSTIFSKRVLKIFSHSHLLTFLPRVSSSSSSMGQTLEPGEMDYSGNDDKVISSARKNSKVYEKLNGRVYDAGKLGRCLVELGLSEEFVRGYVKWKRDGALGGMGFDGAEWNEEWVGEVGGVEGAFADILINF